MPTDAKRQAVAELTEMLRSSSALAVADYRGLKVSEMQSVRRSLRASGVELHVAKNRLLKIAADEAGRAELTSLLAGPTAVAASSGDETAPGEGAAGCPPTVFQGGRPAGRPAGRRSRSTPAVFQQLASLPSRDVLLGRLAGAMASPIAGMAGVLAANLRNLVGVLSAVADQKRASEGGSAA